MHIEKKLPGSFNSKIFHMGAIAPPPRASNYFDQSEPQFETNDRKSCCEHSGCGAGCQLVEMYIY